MKSHPTIYERMTEAAAAIKEILKKEAGIKDSTELPKIGVILGSGLAPIIDSMTHKVIIPYSKIPYFLQPSVQGHVGQLAIGRINDTPVACLMGRFHFYEGHSMADVVFPTRTLYALGIRLLVLTNAAGGINTRYRAGDLMMIQDHLNLTGTNPLIGNEFTELGTRFPDLSEAYHKESSEIVRTSASRLEISMHQGVYAGLLGPAYETPAEVRMLRTLGADAVGMSTVPETIAANHLGMHVVGISCITNLAVGLSPHKLSHTEVLETSRAGADRMKNLIHDAIPKLAKQSLFEESGAV